MRQQGIQLVINGRLEGIKDGFQTPYRKGHRVKQYFPDSHTAGIVKHIYHGLISGNGSQPYAFGYHVGINLIYRACHRILFT
jgi:hypothetical protein